MECDAWSIVRQRRRATAVEPSGDTERSPASLRSARRYQAWTNITKGEDNLFAAEHKLLSAAVSAEEHELLGSSGSGSRSGSGDGGIACAAGQQGEGLAVGSGEAADRKDGVPRPWLGRRSFKRWRPEEETSVHPPEDGDGEQVFGGGVPAAMKLGRKRWKG